MTSTRAPHSKGAWKQNPEIQEQRLSLNVLENQEEESIHCAAREGLMPFVTVLFQGTDLWPVKNKNKNKWHVWNENRIRWEQIPRIVLLFEQNTLGAARVPKEQEKYNFRTVILPQELTHLEQERNESRTATVSEVTVTYLEEQNTVDCTPRTVLLFGESLWLPHYQGIHELLLNFHVCSRNMCSLASRKKNDFSPFHILYLGHHEYFPSCFSTFFKSFVSFCFLKAFCNVKT